MIIILIFRLLMLTALGKSRWFPKKKLNKRQKKKIQHKFMEQLASLIPEISRIRSKEGVLYELIVILLATSTPYGKLSYLLP